MRGFGMRLVTVTGVIRGVGVRHRVGFGRVIAVTVIVVMSFDGRSGVGVVVPPRFAMAVVMIVGSGGLRMTGFRRRGGRVIVVTVAGVVAVVVVRLVFVAHIDLSPSRCARSFCGRSGIT